MAGAVDVQRENVNVTAVSLAGDHAHGVPGGYEPLVLQQVHSALRSMRISCGSYLPVHIRPGGLPREQLPHLRREAAGRGLLGIGRPVASRLRPCGSDEGDASE